MSGKLGLTAGRSDASLAERIARAQATIVKLEQLGSGEWTLRRDQNSEETQLAQYWNNWHNHWNNWHNHWNNWHNHWGNHHHHN